MKTNHRPSRNNKTVAPGFVTGMLAGARKRGISLQPLLNEIGIDLADQDRRIPLDLYATLYNRLIQTLEDEGFALFSRALPPGCFEFLCRSVSTAPHLAEALNRAGRYLHVVLPDLAVNIETTEKSACLCLRETRPLGNDRNDPARIFAFEWLLRLLHGLSAWLVGRGLALDQVDFPYDRPAHADDYPLIYTENFTFGSEHLRASLQLNLLELPVRRDEAALTAFLEGAPGKLTTLYRRDREVVSRVRDLLRSAFPESPGQDEIAAELYLSSRTLHRRLADEGSSFRAIKDALRRDMALSRLSKTDDPIARIAAELGYADTSTFYRACIEWTGTPPSTYRRLRR